MAKGSSLLFTIITFFSLVYPRQASPANDFKDIKETENITQTVFNNKYYLEIPRVGIIEEISENIDPFKITSYMPVIVDKIAQAKSTDSKLLYLFAHSSEFRYKETKSKPIFAPLHMISTGDNVIVNRYGTIKKYQVSKIETVADTNLTPLVQKPGDETLVLQTCWPPQSLHTRLIVTAKKIPTLALK